MCLEKQRGENRKFYHERVARGQCVCCQKAAEVGAFCMTHWFKNVGVPHGLGSKKGTVLLSSIWDEQKGRCAVTGDLLIPGSNASLDHVVPKSKGGTNDRGNLRWVLLLINRMKWDMSHDDFLSMCRRVVREQERQEVKVVEHPTTRSN